VGPDVVTIHLDDNVLISAPDGRIHSGLRQGFLMADTRFVSSYELTIDGQCPVLLNSGALSAYGARYEFTNAEHSAGETAVPEHTIHLRLDRSIGRGVHEDYDLTNYATTPLKITLNVRVESDFADVFDVKEKRHVRRGRLNTFWDADGSRLSTRYQHDDFERWLHLQVERCSTQPAYANGMLSFDVRLEPRDSWHMCLLWMPQTDLTAEPEPPLRACAQLSDGDSVIDLQHREWVDAAVTFSTDDPAVTAVVEQAIEDLASLRLHIDESTATIEDSGEVPPGQEAWVPAGGVPWFVTLFGRDSMLVSLLAMPLSTSFATGSLWTFGLRQADADDDRHDEAPGKIIHELRRGELAHFGLIPQTPYFGAHDAPALYVRAAAELWRWNADREFLDRVRPHVERALAWIDARGDLDGDGFQEYRTRAGDWGYYNQSWKDSGEAIVDAVGNRSVLPIATCELQGYVVAAKRGWADTLAAINGPDGQVDLLRAEADEMVARIEERLWWPEQGTYFLGLDGTKQPIKSVASNPGHLLWCEAVDPGRAAQVSARLAADDMWSGWGVRTLSARHPAYNPFSYQRGSVWPHDNAVLANGLRRYGHHEFADKITRSVFDAAWRFNDHRLPELFAGLTRDRQSFPVQYLGANVPQAWAASAVIDLLAGILGLEPDATNATLTLHPALPEWLTRVTVRRLRVAGATVDLTVSRHGEQHDLDIHRLEGDLDIRLR
ncbi:MAG: glycogen debranching N-terminal domain-containing protein, partial [Ilumatobacteraceae bacterium]